MIKPMVKEANFIYIWSLLNMSTGEKQRIQMVKMVDINVIVNWVAVLLCAYLDVCLAS